jgi:hypothetical protein
MTTEQRAQERWDEIRARSERTVSGLLVFCADCSYNFHLGVRHPDGGGYPCAKHATDEERAAVDAAMSKALIGSEHPFLEMLERSR